MSTARVGSGASSVSEVSLQVQVINRACVPRTPLHRQRLLSVQLKRIAYGRLDGGCMSVHASPGRLCTAYGGCRGEPRKNSKDCAARVRHGVLELSDNKTVLRAGARGRTTVRVTVRIRPR